MNEKLDSYLHKGRRRQLINYLREKVGVRDAGVLEAMNTVPRHLFIESVFDEWAYEDRAFPILSDQTISHPSTVAEQTSLLELSPKEKVLEIGTGCGYQTAILVAMGADVYTIERIKNLYEFSITLLKQLNYQPKKSIYGDGFLGDNSESPFDKIIVTCGASEIPKILFDQLKIGGIIVIPMGKGKEQKLYRFRKLDAKQYTKEEFGTYAFVPMLGNIT